jgi:hypothetical protein
MHTNLARLNAPAAVISLKFADITRRKGSNRTPEASAVAPSVPISLSSRYNSSSVGSKETSEASSDATSAVISFPTVIHNVNSWLVWIPV